MASVITNDVHYKNIARTLREKTNSKKTFFPSEMPQGIETVHEVGKETEKKRFWGNQQEEGARKYCAFLYAGNGWNNDTFKPEHDLQPTNAKSMFQYCHIDNYKEQLSKHGRTFDFSQSTNNDGIFHGSPYLKHLPVISFLNSDSHINAFSWSGIVIIDLLIIKDDGSQTFDRSFDGMKDLEEIRVQGVFGNSLDFGSSSKLSTLSIISIFEALSSRVSGKTLILNKTAVDNMDFTDTAYNSWEELRASKSNWTIVFSYS